MRKRMLLSLIILLFSIQKSFAKDQTEILQQIKEIPYSHSPYIDIAKKSGMTSTILTVIKGDISTKEFRQYKFKKFTIKTEEGTRLAGMLHLEQDGKPHPFIVMVPGLGSSLSFSLWRNYAFPLLKKGNFHILLLENVSSPDWILRNQTLRFSGYEAGYEIYMVLKKIREDATLSPLITKMHLVAFSLGGNDITYTLYFDSILKTHYIDGGAITWSSPADRYMAQEGLRHKKGVNRLAVKEIIFKTRKANSVYRKYGGHSYTWIYQGNLDDVFKDFFTDLTKDYFRKHPHHLLPDKNGIIKCPLINSPETMTYLETERLNHVDEFAPFIEHPFLWINSTDDPIVDYSITGPIINKTPHGKNLALLTLKHGGHTGFPWGYGAKWTNAVLFNYIHYWEKQ